MSNPNFAPMSEEQREAVRLKRIADQEYARANLNISYADEQFWRDKASTFGLRMPLWWVAASETKYVRRACKKLNVDINDFIFSTGFSNLNQLVKANSKWTALGMVGLVVEFALETA